MKRLIFLIIFLSLLQSNFAQTKIDEYECTDSDSESTRIDNFANSLQNDPHSQGSIVLYAGKNSKGFGNLIGHFKGIRGYLKNYRGISESRLEFVISKGKKACVKELWTIGQNEKSPKIEKYVFDSLSLRFRYFYGEECFICEPAVPGLEYARISLPHLADVLNKNRNVKVEIRLTKEQLTYGINVRKKMTRNFGIDESRILIKFDKKLKYTAEYYLVNAF